MVPGTYIDADERDGLPSGKDADDARYEAERVVRSHTRGRRFGMGGKLKRRRTEKRFKTSESYRRSHSPAESEASHDIERDAGKESLDGAGVLSALLTLYDHDTSSASIASTPGRTSIDGVPEKPWMHQKEDNYKRYESRRPRPMSRLSTEISPHSSGTDSPPKPRIGKKTITKFAPSGMFSGSKRPRSDGGVFGPLITSTGNLAGIAAPTSSQLQPDSNKPGYRLSR